METILWIIALVLAAPFVLPWVLPAVAMTKFISDVIKNKELK